MTELILASSKLSLHLTKYLYCMTAALILLNSAVSVIGTATAVTAVDILSLEKLSKVKSTWSRHIRSAPDLSQLSWYVGGKILPRPQSPRLSLLPEEAPEDDRIINQLMHVPVTVTEEKKKILVWDKDRYFSADMCPFQNCIVTEERGEFNTSDAIVFSTNPGDLPKNRKPHQRWILQTLESPMNEFGEKHADIFNWTSTYRHNSDIVYPYNKWVYFNENVRQSAVCLNVAANKTRKVAWYVSNCNAQSNRLEYAKELSKYIEVDIYGECGNKQCSRSHSDDCLNMLKQEYKFYLSFENSICKDYVTEKFFYPLQYNILPVAMGVTREFYTKIAPDHSFIHVDDFNSPKQLADYLNKLDKNDALYNDYFCWHGTGTFLYAHSYYICRICSMLHSDLPPKTYTDVNMYKNRPGECSFRRQGVGAPKRGIQYW